LLDPDRFLVRAMALARKLISPFGAVLWLLVVGAGMKVALDHFGRVAASGRGNSRAE